MSATSSLSSAPGLRDFDLGALMLSPVESRRPDLFRRADDGEPLLYRRAVHAINGEPATGKSWIALAAAVQIIAAGEAVVLVDFEGTPVSVANRLHALGAEPGVVSERLAYVQPDGPVGLVEVDRLRQVADGAALVIVDSLAEAMAQSGLDENAASDVTRWVASFPRALARDGAAVLIVDHVTKASDGRGRWARGSGAKLAAIDAAFGVRLVRSFSRLGSGAAELVVSKDREGCLGAVGDIVANVVFDVRRAGEEVRVRVDSSANGNANPRFGRSSDDDHWVVDLQWVAERCRDSGGWSSIAEATASLGMSEGRGRRLLRQAVVAGLLSEAPGKGGARTYRPAAVVEEEQW